jgi:hypothetical protein
MKLRIPAFSNSKRLPLPLGNKAHQKRRSVRAFSGACIAAAMMMSGAVRMQAQTVVPFTSAGNQTWVCPAGVTSVQVEAYGGGGGGGGVGADFTEAGGGAGGSYVRVASVAVTPGTTYQLTVGRDGGDWRRNRQRRHWGHRRVLLFRKFRRGKLVRRIGRGRGRSRRGPEQHGGHKLEPLHYFPWRGGDDEREHPVLGRCR